MKKNFLYLAMAFMAFAFTACSDDDDNGSSKKDDTEIKGEVKLLDTKSLKHEGEGKDITLKSEIDENVPFDRLILTEDGKAVIENLNVPKIPQAMAKNRASYETENLFLGIYETTDYGYLIYDYDKNPYCYIVVVDKDDTSNLQLYGIKMADPNDLITEREKLMEDMKLYDGEETITLIDESEYTKKLCRTWNISSTRLRHYAFSNGKSAVVKVWDAPAASNLNTILDYAQSKANIDESFDPNMILTDLIFTRTGNIIMFFENGDYYVGKWSWENRAQGVLKYNWDDLGMGNKFENGHATFDVRTYKKKEWYVLTLGADIVNKDDTYKIQLSFYLEEPED